MAAPISKQERVRLNQQRSRARKQEYLQDLEKRVRECHTTCREADLQRESYQQLGRENMKLRTLLGSLGIGEAQIDAYVNADSADHSAEQTSFRYLRPKLLPETSAPQATFLARAEDGDQLIAPNISLSVPSNVVPSTSSSSCCSSARPSVRPEVDDPCSSTSSTLAIPQPQYCTIFHTYFEPTMQPTLEDSVLCAHARDLIDRYNVGGRDIEDISFKLVAGLVPEINPGEGCRVNKRLLFEVLDDISSNLP